jgi:formate C-acetyltransferase
MLALNLLDENFGNHWPNAYLSSLMDGCLENGKDVTKGGAIYNNSVVNSCGVSNTANSLAAIKQIVFDEKLLTLRQLAEILRSNFKGNDAIRQKLKNCPKYGNNNEIVDVIFTEITDAFCEAVNGRNNLRGGVYMVGMYTVYDHAFMGRITGASSDGRLSGRALASSMSPVQGTETDGPTSSALTATKTDHTKFANGMVLDMKVHPRFFGSDRHRDGFWNLIRTYFKKGGMEIQFNVVKRETMIAAQRHPENYKDLIVRVSGVSAYFTTLSRTLQDEIISRTEFGA